MGTDYNIEIADPLNENAWQALQKQAKENTEIYREIFGCDPDDTISNTKELLAMRGRIKARSVEEQLAIYEKLKQSIKGHLVEWPTMFMKAEDLQVGWTQVEGVLPERNFL